MSYAQHGPCSPSTNESRPDAIEWLLPVAAYTLPHAGDALSTVGKSNDAMAQKTPVTLPSSALRLRPAACSAS